MIINNDTINNKSSSKYLYGDGGNIAVRRTSYTGSGNTNSNISVFYPSGGEEGNTTLLSFILILGNNNDFAFLNVFSTLFGMMKPSGSGSTYPITVTLDTRIRWSASSAQYAMNVSNVKYVVYMFSYLVYA